MASKAPPSIPLSTRPRAPGGALSAGEKLDRYELLCILAQGGMGSVWLGRMSGKLGFERLVAIKTILPSYSSDRRFSDMFLDEARIAAQIDHENVARILEIGEDQGILYYVMELIDGHSVRKLYRDVRATKQPFPLGVALRIVADAAAGLHAVHELRNDEGALQGIVHRDVSPQNLLLSTRGSTKLIDFGVAKANSRSTEQTAAGTLKGKLEYMAPEQAMGKALDRRADVFALGAVLFELLAGRPVRETDNGRQLKVLHDIMTGVAYRPLPDSIPEPVRRVVDRALGREPEQRYGTAAALREAIEHAIEITGTTATREEVAAAIATYSKTRTAKRKQLVENATRVAAEGRLEAETMVGPLDAAPAASGDTSRLPAPPVTGPTGASLAPAAAVDAELPVVDGTSEPPVDVASDPPPADPGARASAPPATTPTWLHTPAPSPGVFDASVTGPSMQSMGAAMSASVSPPARPRTSVGKVLGVLLLLVFVGAAGVVLGIFITRRSERLRTIALPGDAPPAPAASSAPASSSAGPVAPLASLAVPDAPPTGVIAAGPAPSTSAAPSLSPSARGGKDAGGGKRRGGHARP